MAELLDAQRISEALAPSTRAALERLTVLQEVDSTNAELARRPSGERHAHALLADCQTMGRGRRQRHWHSPAGGNIYLSLGWRFERTAPSLSCLPLVTAVCVAHALAQAGFDNHGIKWPNDILCVGKKLAGILVEVQSTGDGPLLAVIGIGLNVRMPETAETAVIDRPWTDLASQLSAGAGAADRNHLVAGLLDELLAALPVFAESGFQPFRAAWEKYDCLFGRRVQIEQDGTLVTGVARGIGWDGNLILERDNGLRSVFHAGDVSVLHEP